MMRTRGGVRLRTGAPGLYVTGSGRLYVTGSGPKTEKRRSSPKNGTKASSGAQPIRRRRPKHACVIGLVRARGTATYTVSCSCGWKFSTRSRNEAIQKNNQHLTGRASSTSKKRANQARRSKPRTKNKTV